MRVAGGDALVRADHHRTPTVLRGSSATPSGPAMLRRQHELLLSWKAQGWRELEPDVESAPEVA